MFKKLLCSLLLLVIASASWAENVVPGDVSVVFKAEPGTKVTTESLSEGGRDFERVKIIAEELDADLITIYSALSKQKNGVFALLHSNTISEHFLVNKLLLRSDVCAASPNHILQTYSIEPNDLFFFQPSLLFMPFMYLKLGQQVLGTAILM